jgi:CheY-like chemotaxis protein
VKASHGPYWYAVWREGKRTRSRYIGKTLPDGADSASALDAGGRGIRYRIAIITDDLQNRMSTQSILLHEGYITVVLTEAKDAFLRLMHIPPDAILLDLRLGSAESYWLVLRLVRPMPALRTAPLILCASEDLALAAAAPELATLDCTVLLTPVVAAELLAVLLRAWGTRINKGD